MVRVERDAADKTKRVETRFISDDPRDLNGPPYGVVESVFDEYDVEGCTLEPENELPPTEPSRQLRENDRP
ncbi:hypothetical protein AGMMS50256_21520 [Betaproteobacteria bacterium]|nr:hypothetical protein AGMMS50256_21520 [Betaproteobacteria bacterium]